MRYSVCTDAVYHGIPTTEAIARVAGAGGRAIEFWGFENKDMEAIIHAAKAHNIAIAAFCVKDAVLVDPRKRGLFLSGLAETLAMAKKTLTSVLICTAGQDTGAPRSEQAQSVVHGLREAAPLLAEAGVTLALEPLNIRYDHAGYYLFSSDEGFDILDEVNSPHVKLLFDIYHQQLTEGDILNRIRANIQKIGHFHSAGVPGRHELDTGELHYANIVQAIDEMGYASFFGLEYFPERNTEEGLEKLFSVK
jgi:hydroxypyruvate isomerase